MFIDVYLIIAFLGIGLSVVFIGLLRSRIPRESATYKQLFLTGSVYPYTEFDSLNLKFFLPWIDAPDLSQFGSSASKLFFLARVSAWLGAIAVLTLVLTGLLRQWQYL